MFSKVLFSKFICVLCFHLSPIISKVHLSPIVSKVLEDFVVEWLIEDVEHFIDFSQFGCLKGTSTTYCLLDMMHNWLSSIDKPGMFLRACILDFSKAFDHIDHTILVNKLIHLGVRGFIIRWICSFLSGRRQAVKIKNQGGLAATFDLAAFLVSMIAPVKKSVNHLRILPSMRITGNRNMFSPPFFVRDLPSI